MNDPFQDWYNSLPENTIANYATSDIQVVTPNVFSPPPVTNMRLFQYIVGDVREEHREGQRITQEDLTALLLAITQAPVSALHTDLGPYAGLYIRGDQGRAHFERTLKKLTQECTLNSGVIQNPDRWLRDYAL